MNDQDLQALMVKNEFANAGYTANNFAGGKIEISLSCRKVNTVEVKYILEKEFDGIEFEVRATWNGVLVTV